MEIIKKFKEYRKFFLFGIVGILGVIVNTFLLYIFTFYVGLYYLLSSVIATESAIISNFFGNHLLTFKNAKNHSPTYKKFLKFQTISLITIGGTVSILAILTYFFGLKYLIISNAIAIFVMFFSNYSLNKKFTWGEKKINKKNIISKFNLVVIVLLVIVLSGNASAALVAVSQMGLHSDSSKQVIFYGSNPPSEFFIINSIGQTVYSGRLEKPTDYLGKKVECQGNNPCVVGNFDNFTSEGDYQIKINGVEDNINLKISNSVYQDNIPILLEFFNAQKQQNSDYHADFHSNYEPELLIIADGSFIMESHQASKSLIRLGSAYNRNPEIFENSDIADHIRDYTDYLMGLQGLEIEEMRPSDEGYEDGFILNRGVKINNVFVPGPTDLTEIKVYDSGDNPDVTDVVEVISLCGLNDGSTNWQECIDFAEEFYKCQIDEPCINATYIENTGKVVGKSGFGVATGWSTEFGCFFDIELNEEMYDGKTNPCLIFNPQEVKLDTLIALTAMLEAIPSLYDSDEEYALEVYENSIDTYQYIKDEYSSKYNSDESAFWGTSLFLLYQYSGDEKYLIEAYALRNSVSKTFISDETRGNEFYWEEYILHKSDIENIGTYTLSGKNPEEFFQDKIFFDWKDRGPLAISKNGERVFQFDNNIRFQNSRFMLTEGVLASKAQETHPMPEKFVNIVADNQLTWLSGMNAVQEGTGLNADVRSYSFIFGIAPNINPNEFHSRYLINTGFNKATDGKVVGVKGIGKQFYNGTAFIYFDGKTTILGNELGAVGNKYNGEEETDLWGNDIFKNGKENIPGWINGVFDVEDGEETDVIFNYEDTRDTYEFTETTNEMVATAIELVSYRDAYYNNRAPRNFSMLSYPPLELQNGTLLINSTPINAKIYIDSELIDKLTSSEINLSPGSHNISLQLMGYNSQSKIIQITEDEKQNIDFVLIPIINNSGSALIRITSTPLNAEIYVDSLFTNKTTPSTITAYSGVSNISISIDGYKTQTKLVNVSSGEDQNLRFILVLNDVNETNETQSNTTDTLPEDSPSSGGGTGGGQISNSDNNKEIVDIVYAIFSKDVLNVGETQTITLDAKARNGGVRDVEVKLILPNGQEKLVALKKISGTSTYGTWQVQLNESLTGLYKMSTIRLRGYGETKEFNILDRTFYVIGTGIGENEELMIVYTILSESVVENVSDVKIILDSRDSLGVESITANVEAVRGGKIENTQNVVFDFVSGTKKYGTWEGTFLVDSPDTTYTIKNITLNNLNNAKVHEIQNRSVYASFSSPTILDSENGFGSITGNIIATDIIRDIRKDPLAPVKIGFLILILIAAGVLFKFKIKNKRQ
jgi:putative flippase GtrA